MTDMFFYLIFLKWKALTIAGEVSTIWRSS